MSLANQPEKMSLESMSITDLQKAKLKELFPEVFTEGSKIDFDRLKRTLGEMIDSGKERFGMQWAGKADCFKTIQQPSIATLVPCPEESIDFDTTENMFIEGDNLEVLKLLQKSYLGKIKMIYIDPPYNTGSDFIYPDNYSENLDTYLEYTGQIDGEGRKFSTNVDTDGRFHSKWMNMMYPRLFLAKNLLRDDGVIFISIGEREEANLKQILCEVFGEENYITTLIWEKKKKGAFLSGTHTNIKDYIIVFSKNSSAFTGLVGEVNDDAGTYPCINEGNRRDTRTIPSGIQSKFKQSDYFLASGSTISAGTMDIKLLSDLIIKNNVLSQDLILEGNWRYGQDSMEEFAEADELYLTEDLYIRRIVTHPRIKKLKDFLPKSGTSVDHNNYYLQSYDLKNLFLSGWGTNEDAKDEILQLTNVKNLMDYPKPSKLIAKLAQSIQTNDCIILDFFAGSGTTADAIMQLNKLDGGTRKFICVQLPEKTYDIKDGNEIAKKESKSAFDSGYKTIAEITKERIRRASAKIKAQAEANTDLLTEEKAPLDLGFRVFKLQKSNFKVWDATLEKDAANIQLALEAHIDHIDPNATQQSILFELLLKAGFELTTPIETLTLANKTVFSIAEGALLICLEKELTLDLIKAIADLEPSRVIVLDEGFQNNDQLKTNASLTLKAKGVVDFRTV